MPQIVQSGSINTTALVVPDLYVQIVPPATLLLNGVPTNVVGIVGTAQWGPVGQAITCASMADYARNFGNVQNRKYDAGTQLATAVQQGAQNFRVVRATDGTDTAATIAVLTNCITFTALYTGTLGNTVGVTLSSGSKASTTRAVITAPGYASEVFDNIAGTGNAFWVALAAAINAGTSVFRGPSQWVTAAAGVGTTAATLGTTYTLAGGTDGVATLTAAVLVGLDTIPRKGMYALARAGLQRGAAGRHRRQHAVDHPGGFRAVRGRLHDLHRPGRRHHRERDHHQGHRRARQLRRQADVRRLDLLERPGEPGSAPGLAAGLRGGPAGQFVAPEQLAQQAALFRGRLAEVGPQPFAVQHLCVRRPAIALPGRHRRDFQPAAGRLVLGRALRPQLQQQPIDQRRQLHADDQLHRGNARGRHGRLRRAGDHLTVVRPYPRDASGLPERTVVARVAGQHRRQHAIQCGMRHHEQSNQPNRARLRPSRYASPISGDQREVYRQP